MFTSNEIRSITREIADVFAQDTKAMIKDLARASAAAIHSFGALNGGSGRSLLDGPMGTKKLDERMSKVLRRHLKQGGTVEKFFEYNEDLLGSQSDYDLTEFLTK